MFEYRDNHKVCIDQSACANFYTFNASEDEKQCFKLCPDYAPNLQNGECVDRCDDGVVEINNDKLQRLSCKEGKCEYYYAENKSLTNNTICYNECPQEMPKVHDFQCLVECGAELFEYGNNCYENCPQPLRNAENQMCSSNCTFYSDESDNIRWCTPHENSCTETDYPYLLGNECFKSCPDGYFVENGRCVEKCGEGSDSYTLDANN